MLKQNLEPFLGCDCAYDPSTIAIFGAPFDGTTSFRPGTRFGSKAMRAESFGIETYSPYQDRDLTDIKVFDAGDLDLPFGNPARVLDMIAERTKQLLNDRKLPVMLGGEHLITLGAIRSMIERHPDLCILHFDAHTDLRDDYLGEKLSHASVMRRAWELVGDGRIHQFGIRSGEREEFLFAKEHTLIHRYNVADVPEAIKSLNGKPVYVSIDLDVMDPSIFPGTGTPEAGGVSFTEMLNAVLSLSGLNIVGCDMVELSPAYDMSGVSTAVACKLLRELLLILGREEI